MIIFDINYPREIQVKTHFTHWSSTNYSYVKDKLDVNKYGTEKCFI